MSSTGSTSRLRRRPSISRRRARRTTTAFARNGSNRNGATATTRRASSRRGRAPKAAPTVLGEGHPHGQTPLGDDPRMPGGAQRVLHLERGRRLPVRLSADSAGDTRFERFSDIWTHSQLFQQLRNPEALEGKCRLPVRSSLRRLPRPRVCRNRKFPRRGAVLHLSAGSRRAEAREHHRHPLH